MVILIRIRRQEELLSRKQLIEDAGKRPHICRGGVGSPHNYLGSPVVQSLNESREVMVGPAGITQISNLYSYILV